MLETKEGPISIVAHRRQARDLQLPGHPDRPVALKRRELPELLAEELRRLDEDDVYADDRQALVKIGARAVTTDPRDRGPRRPRRPGRQRWPASC